ncbi:hypothetical protein ACFQ0M_43155 [Kitasatospora aburaviensis]
MTDPQLLLNALDHQFRGFRTFWFDRISPPARSSCRPRAAPSSNGPPSGWPACCAGRRRAWARTAWPGTGPWASTSG